MHVCGTSVVLGPWYSVRVLIQHSVITFRASSMADTDIDDINNKKHIQFLSCDRSTGSCMCPCRQNITDTHKRHIRDPVLLYHKVEILLPCLHVAVAVFLELLTFITFHSLTGLDCGCVLVMLLRPLSCTILLSRPAIL